MHLTKREREVMRLASNGSTDYEIAARIGTSVRTVNFHLRNVYEKTESANRIEAALKTGFLIQGDPK